METGKVGKVFGQAFGEYAWCFRCWKASRTEAWACEGWRCPDCCSPRGSMLAWTLLRQQWPHYPETPAAGQEYCLCGHTDTAFHCECKHVRRSMEFMFGYQGH